MSAGFETSQFIFGVLKRLNRWHLPCQQFSAYGQRVKLLALSTREHARLSHVD